MNVTIIGTGNMGSALAKQFVNAGNRVNLIGRDQDKAARTAKETDASISDSVGDVVVLATAYADAAAALQRLGERHDLSGKIVIDITNPLTADYMGLTIGHSTSAAEQIQQAVPAVKVVKAFNTVFAQVIAAGPDFGAHQTVPVYIAGDDVRAKEVVTALVAGTGFQTIDAGGLVNARYLEPLAGLNIYFGYGAGQGTDIAPAWIKRAA